ncbi:MAG: DUF1552 domain-containing protein [Lentisphaerales bacterium]|nr:DUF1552 domain-containing protein [Lentisphaerales bacterium]
MTTRRNFLKNTMMTTGGLAILPSFSNIFAASKANKAPHRFIFIRKSNGNLPKQFSLPSFSVQQKTMDQKKKPFEADLDKHELPKWLRALEPYKANMSILHGVSAEMSQGGHFSYSSCMGAFKCGRDVLTNIKRATIDFEIARMFPSPFGHVELSLTGNYSSFRKGIVSGYSASGPQQRNYCYADPMTAYNELFKSVTNPGAVNSENMLLDYLRDQETKNVKGLDGTERLKLSNHIESLQAVKRRNIEVAKMSGVIKKHLPTLDKIHENGGSNATTPQKQQGMTDVLIAALISGLTNVVTYTIDELSTPYRGLPGYEGDNISVHAIGHNESYGGNAPEDTRDTIKAGHIAQIEKIIKKLKAVPEGNGNMFDNTTIVYMPESGAGHHGPQNEMPMVIMSGDNTRLDINGRFIRLPFHGEEGHKTMGNWYTTLLNAWGNPMKHYGDLDLTMSRKKLPQLGSIKQIMG